MFATLKNVFIAGDLFSLSLTFGLLILLLLKRAIFI